MMNVTDEMLKLTATVELDLMELENHKDMELVNIETARNTWKEAKKTNSIFIKEVAEMGAILKDVSAAYDECYQKIKQAHEQMCSIIERPNVKESICHTNQKKSN